MSPEKEPRFVLIDLAQIDLARIRLANFNAETAEQALIDLLLDCWYASEAYEADPYKFPDFDTWIAENVRKPKQK